MTASGWGAYYLFFLAGGAALAIPLILGFVSSLLRRQASARKVNPDPFVQNKESAGAAETIGSAWGAKRVNTRYFHGASLSLALTALVFVLAPLAAGVRQHRDQLGALVLGVLLLSTYAFLAILYVSRKGDAHWLASFQGRDHDGE